MNELALLPGSFILRADIEGQMSCTVSAKDGLSLKDVFWEKLENTGGRKWENFLVFTKWTRVHIEWEMNCSCVRGHALLIINKLDKLPIPLPGAHHFMRKDVIHAAAGPYSEKDFYYIIRPSGSAKNLGSFALVITTPSFPSGRSCLRHVTVGYNKDTDNFVLCSKEFDSLDSLVTFFKNTPIKAHNGPNMYLRHPVPVDPQLDEESKKPWRTTRTGQRTDGSEGEAVDTISLWSCSSSLTPNSYSLSYDYDGSVSGLSEDDQLYEASKSLKERFRGSTIVNREATSPMSPMSCLSLSQHSNSDVEMRAQSGSSSGASLSGGSVSSSASRPRSHFYCTAPASTKPTGKLQRPFSEVLKGSAEKCNLDSVRTNSVPPAFLLQVRQTGTGDTCPVEPEETYVEMIPTINRITHPQQGLLQKPHSPELRTDTMVRHPGASCSGSDNEQSGTLTRGEENDSCYMNITIDKEKDSSRDCDANEPAETYVEMNQLRTCPQKLVKSEHDYVNRSAVPQSTYDTDYHAHGMTNFDPVTTQKLIDNVQNLMVTVQEQAKEILTLKMTVKDLKLKVEALEHFESEAYEYDQ